MKPIRISIAAGLLLLTGCVGPLVPVRTVEQAGIQTVEAAFHMPVVPAEEAKERQALGEVVGYSCKNKIWDASATAEAATHQVKIAAAQLGATVITAVACEAGGASALLSNCWQSYRCRADALR